MTFSLLAIAFFSSPSNSQSVVWPLEGHWLETKGTMKVLSHSVIL